MMDARPEGATPGDTNERMERSCGVEGNVPLSAGSTPAPRKVKYPCRWCTERKLYCHSICPDYKAWCEQEERKKKAERDRKTFTLSDNGRKSIWRAMKKR